MLRSDDVRAFGNFAVMSAFLLLAGCGGGGGGGSGGSSPTPVAAAPVISVADADRLAKQGSFGPTKTLVDHIVSLGSASAWVDEQLSASGSGYTDLSARAVATNYCSGMAASAQSVCNRDYMSSIPVAMEFYAHAAQNSDQLRQRVAFALSQLIVTSDLEVHSTAGTATFNGILLTNAFGNYRDIIKAVTLNPYMGSYLNLANSSKNAPNENYARELMQLFTTGVNQLNADGSVVTDSTGAPVPVYTASDVHDIARALTGLTYARLNGAAITDNVNLDYSSPMIVNSATYDSTAKSFLGASVAAGATQDTSMEAVIDAVFNNASTGPHVSKFLIQHLVTANPSAAYVSRISAVFANDGSGNRGNMKAVVRAILLDTEARGDSQSASSYGKVKEPVLFMVSIARLIGDTTDGYAFTTRDAAMGQAPFRAPSVFNFYPPDYPLPLGGGLLSPASKLVTSATVITRHNLAYDWTVNGDAANRPEYAVQSTISGATGTQPDWTLWQGYGTDTNGMLAEINALMLNNTMTSSQQAALAAAVNAVTNADPPTQARRRAQTALYIVATSPQFQVDR